MYSPLRHWKVGKGSKVGVIGLGGLGHMALKFAHAFGAQVVLSNDPGQVKQHAGSFDFILDTVSAPHDLNGYPRMLNRDGTTVLVGLPGPRRRSEAVR